MRNLKIPIILLFIYISIIFNIEGLAALGGLKEFELNHYASFLILVIIISTFIFSPFRKLASYSNLGFWVFVYFGVWFVSPRSAVPQYVLLTVLAEIFLVSIAVILAREVAIKLHEVESTLDKLVFASFRGRTMSMDEAANEIKTELLRSRRYQRALTVLVLEPDPSTIKKSMIATVEEIQNNLAQRYAMGKISEVINASARRPDLVIKHDRPDRFVLICPETTSDSSGILSRRIQNAVKADLGVSISVGMASFPNEALTFEELLQKASAKLEKTSHQVTPVTQEENVNASNQKS